MIDFIGNDKQFIGNDKHFIGNGKHYERHCEYVPSLKFSPFADFDVIR